MRNFINKKLKALSPKHQASLGFSLIELIVAMSIMIIISSVALFNQAKFSSDILISNMAYEVALTIRQAQMYGISSKGNEDAQSLQGSEQYRVGYGVHFGVDELGEMNPSKFITFIDVPAQGGAAAPGESASFNYKFDIDDSTGQTDVGVFDIDLTQGQKIHSFCVHQSGVGWNNCWGAVPTDTTNKSLDIVFVKPNPDAHITFWDGNAFSGNILNGVKYDRAKIVIESGLGDKCRAVTVYASGQVSVDPIDPNIPNGGCGIDWATLQ